MLETISYVIITLVAAYIFANAIVGKNKERLRYERLERKLNREDLALHDLTACRED